MERLIATILVNFSMLALGAALAIGVATAARRGMSRATLADQLFRWTALLAAGMTGLYTFVAHFFFPVQTAAAIGWPTSVFQSEIAMANLAVGVLGILAFRADRGFRLATAIAAAVWLWGDALVHVREMVLRSNFAPGNAGPWFWSDVLVPAVLAVTLAASRPRKTCGVFEVPPGNSALNVVGKTAAPG